MKIIKRNGEQRDFDSAKIKTAIVKANQTVARPHMLTDMQIKRIVKYVTQACETLGRPVNVEEIQDMVENHLMGTMAFEVAKHYILYRYEHEKARRRNNELETELFRHPDYLTEINPTGN